MPTVPNLEAPQVEAEALPGRANPRIDDTVNPAAYGAPLAQGIDALSAAAVQQQVKEKTQNDQLRVIDANTQLEAGRNAMLYGSPDKDTGQMTGGAFSLKGLDAINMPAKLTPQYDALAAGIAGTLTPDQQRLFHPHVAAGSNELNLQLNRYEFEQHNQMADSIFSNGAKQAVESASVGWRDPMQIGKSRADIKSLVQMQGDRQGWNQDQKDEQTQKLLAEMHFSVVDRMLASGSPQAALDYFIGSKDEPGPRDSKELTGQEAHQLGATIDEALRQQAVQNQSQVANKVRDVRAAAINGQLVPPSSMPSEAELRAAYPDTWPEVTDSINRDVQMGADLKSYAALPPDQIAAHVENYKPSGVEGAAESYDRYNVAAQAASRVMAERAKDPRQYAIDNKLGSQPLDLSNPNTTGAEIRARLAATPALAKQMGGAVPLLSRGEAATLAASFDSQTPQDKLRTLNTLASSIQDDQGFQAVMHQVLPSSPVTAIVGNQVVSANPHTPAVWFDRQFAANPTDQTRILKGEELLNPAKDEKGAARTTFPIPAEGGQTGLRGQFADKTGDLFRNRPELQEHYYQAFKDAYAALLSEKGDSSGNGNPTLRDQAVRIALGNQTRFNGQAVSVPQGMDPTRFQGLVNNAVVARGKAAGAPDGWTDKIRGYQLQEQDDLGSGRYRLVNGTLPMTLDGKTAFEIDLRGDYLPSHAHGSPQDQARLTAQVPAIPPGIDSLAAGNVPRVSRGTSDAKALTAPAIHTGGAGRAGRDHPSQGAPTL